MNDEEFQNEGLERERLIPMADDSSGVRDARLPVIQWTTVIIVILTWLMSAALTYGVISTKVNYLEDRVKTLETNQRDVMTRMHSPGTNTKSCISSWPTRSERNRTELGGRSTA